MIEGNKFGVGVQGGKVVILFWHKAMSGLSPEEGLEFAAWVVALSGQSLEEFQKVYEEVCNA